MYKDSILFLDKPKGISSHSAVNIVRKALSTKKVGHTGTLDPLATGLMIICIGRATKLATDFVSLDKEYIANIEFGYETDTLDSEGVVIKKSGLPTREAFSRAVDKLLLLKEQIPPKYSAIKIDGVRAYKKALRDDDFKMDPRPIKIYNIDVLSFNEREAVIRTKVSKGTYIRSLVRDLAKYSNTSATLTELRRISTAGYSIKDAITIEELKERASNNKFNFLKPVEIFYKQLPKLELNEEEYNKYMNGAFFTSEMDGKHRVYFNTQFIGLANIKHKIVKEYKYKKINSQ